MKLHGAVVSSSLQAAVLLLSLNFVQTEAAAVSGCVGGGASDVVFLLDSSYSIWRPDFRRQLTFVQEIIEMLPIGPNNTRVAIVTYADYPQLQFHLGQYSAKPDLRAAVEGIRQRGGFQTTSGDAIRFIRSNVFQVGIRSQHLEVDVARVVVVITNGRSDNWTATVIEAELAKKEGIRMIVVGVGKDLDLDELKDVGSLPTEEHTFIIDNYAGLGGIRDLVATETCKVRESVMNTNVFATSAAATRLQNTKAVSTETSLSNEKSTTLDNGNNASFSKAIFKAGGSPVTASSRKTSVNTTLSALISSLVEFTSTTAIAAFLPSKAPYPKSAHTRPVVVRLESSRAGYSRAASSRAGFSRASSSGAASSRAASTTVASGAGVTSPVSSTTTSKPMPVSAGISFSETAVLPTKNVNYPPSAEITGAKGLYKDEDFQPSSRELPMAIIAITDRGVQTDNNHTAASKQPPTVFLTHNASDFQPGNDSTEDVDKTTSGLETSCGLGLLDRILSGKSSSEAPKKDGETADKKGRDDERERSTNVGNTEIDSGVKAQQDNEKISGSRSRRTTSTAVVLTQVTRDINDAGTKMIFEATSTKSIREAFMTVGTTTTESTLIDDSQERNVVIAGEYGNRGFEEGRAMSKDNATSDQNQGETGRGRERNGRLEQESGYEAKDYWRLTDGGKLILYRLIRPDVYEREAKASHRAPPRLQSNPRRRVISRSAGIHSSTGLDDHNEQDRGGHLNHESTDEGIRENHSKPVHSLNPGYSSRLNTRTNGKRDGHPRGTDTGGVIRSSHKEALERPNTHKPQTTSSGYWRLNDSGKLVWMDNPPTKRILPSESHATRNPNTKSPRAQRKNTSIDPGFWHTHGPLKVNGADHLASNSAAHPILATNNHMVQTTSLVTKMKDVTQSFQDQRSTPRSPGAEIESHNPKHGYWKYDRSGRNSVWVIYTRNDDYVSTADSTTDAQATTHAGVVSTSGTKGPSLFDSDGLSYGYWMRENGKPVWFEYQSPGVYRKVIDTDPLEAPNKIRIELPPGRVPNCAGCSPTDSRIRMNRPVKVNQSSSSEEVVVFKARDMAEKVIVNLTRPIALDNRNRDPWKALENLRQRFSEGSNSNSSQFDTSANSHIEELSTLRERTENAMSLVHRYNRTGLSTSDHRSHDISIQSPQLVSVVRGKNDAGNSKSNLTYENYYNVWIRGHNKRRIDKGRSARTTTAPGAQQDVEENQSSSSISTTLNPRRDGANWSNKTTSSVSSPSPNRRKPGSRNSKRVVCVDSEHKKGCLVRKKPSAAKTKRKHAKGCVARSPLDVVFLVDPRAREIPYTRHLWQLAYEVVSQVRMDDNRIRVRFYPELEVVRASTASNRSAEYGNVQTVIQKVAQKPVPELLRAASRLLAKLERGVRRIGIYLTDGPSGTPLELSRAAEEVKGEAAVEMFAIGIGQETNPAELEMIAADSKLEGNHLYRLTRPMKSDIDALALKLRNALCGGR